MSYKSRAARAAFLVFSMTVLGAVCGYLLRILLSRSIPQADYGLFYSVLALFQLIIVFREFGLHAALIKFIPELLVRKAYKQIKGSIISIFLFHSVLSVLLSIIMFITAPFLAATYFKHPLALPVILIVTVYFLISFAENKFTSMFLGFQSMVFYGISPFLRAFSILALTAFFLQQGLGVFAIAYAFLLTYLLLPVLYFWLFTKYTFPSFFKIPAVFEKKLLRRILRFGYFTILTSAGAVVLSYIDTLLLTYFTDLESVALYQVAMPTATFIWFFSMAVSAVLFPIASELWARKEYEKLKQGVHILHKYAVLIVAPMAVVLLFFSPLILLILFGQEYTAAARTLQILSIGAVGYSLALINNHLLLGIDRPHINAKIVLYSTLVNLVLNLLLIPRYGIEGAAVATSLSFFFMLLLSTSHLKKALSIREPWYDWIKIAIIAGALVIILTYVKSLILLSIWWEIIILLIVAGAAYGLLLFVFRLVTFREIRELLRGI